MSKKVNSLSSSDKRLFIIVRGTDLPFGDRYWIKCVLITDSLQSLCLMRPQSVRNNNLAGARCPGLLTFLLVESREYSTACLTKPAPYISCPMIMARFSGLRRLITVSHGVINNDYDITEDILRSFNAL